MTVATKAIVRPAHKAPLMVVAAGNDPDGTGTPPIDGYIAWYHADALSLTSGAAVALWPDSSGNGHDLSQATGARQPSFNNNQINGLPAVSFNLTASTILSTAAFTLNQPATVFMVATNTADGTYYTDGLAQNTRVVQRNTGTKLRGYAGGIIDATVTTLAAWAVLGVVFSGSSGWVSFNNVETSGNIGAASASGIALGGYPTGGYMTGLVAEAIFYNRALSAAERAIIARYLGAKYGITVS